MRSPSTIRFGADNRGTKPCIVCGVLSWQSRQDHESTGDICVGCYESAGYENEHNDSLGTHNYSGGDEIRDEPKCPICHPEHEERRLARAAERVASYQVAAAARAERALAKEATYPHCPRCGQRRPKTKQWEKTGESKPCSDCASDLYWIAFYTSEVPSQADAAIYQKSLARRAERHGGPR